MAPRRRRRRISPAQRVREELLADPANAADPPCALHDTCGGCTWQDVRYAAQLEAKRELVARCFTEVGLDDAVRLVAAPCPSPAVFRYRNQMEFSFAARRWLTAAEIDSGEEFDREFALGLHAPGGFDRILHVPRCWLQSETADAVLTATADAARRSGLPAYDTRTHEGFWRWATIRASVADDELLLDVVTSARDEGAMAALAGAVTASCPRVTTIANGVTDRVADSSAGAEVFVDHGPGFLVESLNGIEFEVAAASFFQPNTAAAAELFRWVAGQVRGERVLDLYCGSGAAALHVARGGREVVGYEAFGPSVEAARRNARRNGIEGCRFEVRDLERGLPADVGEPSCVVSDPPRAGMHRRLVAALAALAAPRVVSIGCNPRSQAENLAELMRAAPYEITAMRAFDQFPHTPHVENVAVLDLRASS